MDAIALISGGMDSCVTAAIAKSEVGSLGALFVDYGQRTTERERWGFDAICDHFGIGKRLVADIGYLAAIGGSSLTDREVPVTEANLDAADMPTSYVAFRNTHLLAIAVSWAEVQDARAVYIGAVEEDSSGYPDCRRVYYDAFEEVVRLGTRMTDFEVRTPVIHMRKSDIVRKGVELGAPLHLTWSCYRGEDLACGTCDSCALRLRGFREAGVEDPLPYAVRPSW